MAIALKTIPWKTPSGGACLPTIDPPSAPPGKIHATQVRQRSRPENIARTMVCPPLTVGAAPAS
ncbi:hypothetical protein IG631_22742 [Alternaria alternata]|nr:hypothetical protein IG631_22742 [Alternaria alternata]